MRSRVRAGLSMFLLCACSSGLTTAPSDVDASVVDGAQDPRDASVDAVEIDGAHASDTSVNNGCITDTSPGQHAFVCDGLKYDVSVPPTCASGCGLVLDVHGATMDATMEDANTNMRALGAQHRFVVVQPNANPAPPSSSWNPITDDAKVFAFLQAAITAWTIDPKRVHMTGFSQGGMMTFRFLCKHADVFASMAPAAGDGCSFVPGDTPSRQVPVLYMHGTKDNLVNYLSMALPQRNEVIAGWQMNAGQVVASDVNYTRTRYTSMSGNVFEFLSHDYFAISAILGGHCYPGSTDPGTAKGQVFAFGCIGPNAFNWGDQVMNFFLAHPK